MIKIGEIAKAFIVRNLQRIGVFKAGPSPTIQTQALSNKAKADQQAFKNRDALSREELGIRSTELPRIVYCDKGVMIGNEERLYFELPADEAVAVDKLMGVYELITELNKLIPSMPIGEIEILGKNDQRHLKGEYDDHRHMIKIRLDEHYLEAAAHEMGHAIFRVGLWAGPEPGEGWNIVNDDLWLKLYLMALGAENYKLVKDSNYTGEEEAGHPHANASELFASSFLIYRLYPEEFIQNILNPEIKEETRNFGKLVFCYLRDNIYGGRVFSESDPFGRISFEINDEETKKHLCSAFESDRWMIRRTIVQTIGKLGIRDEQLDQILIRGLKDSAFVVRADAVYAIRRFGKIIDEKFIIPLIGALGDDDPNVRFAVSNVIVSSRDKRFVKLLKQMVESKNIVISSKAAQIIAEIEKKV